MTKAVLIRMLSGCARLAVFVVLCVLMPALTATASTLANYRERVHEALIAVDTLAASIEEADEETEAETIEEVRRLLPATEKVERAGGAATVVHNEWLHRALDEYENNADAHNAETRSAALARIAERLHALEARLAEAEGGPAQQQQARDKDAEKGRLATILRGAEYDRKKASEGGALRRLLRQILEWISDLFPDVNPIRPGSGRPSRLVQVVVFALALSGIAFIVWKYWVRRRDSLKRVTPKEARVVLGERIAPEQTASDLLAEAELLAREGELRGAIRKAYVALLCELGDRKIIRLAQHKTNRDYLRAVRQAAPKQLYEEMQPLTAGFERHWYGLEEADQSDWADFRTRCRQALNFK